MAAGTGAVAGRIGEAVSRWIGTLDAAQRAAALHDFASPERFVWTYLPGPRVGLPLSEMSWHQRTAAVAILDAALSFRGAAEVRAIFALELILRELEGRSGADAAYRDPDRFWFAAFGLPGERNAWSWRVGGHHVALHLTIADGQVVGSAPSFLGANPATVPHGPFAGSRALDGEESLARALLAALTPEQRDIAVIDPIAPADIRSGTGRVADLGAVPAGVAYERLDRGPQAGFERLVRHYLERAGAEIAEAEWDRIRAAGLASLTFAWAGSEQPGRGHYYAIRGPRTLIEYDNTQNGANHIHSVWRDPTNDWGEDLLAAHYRAAHGSG